MRCPPAGDSRTARLFRRSELTWRSPARTCRTPTTPGGTKSTPCPASRCNSERIVERQVHEHPHQAPLQPGRTEEGLEDPLPGGLVEAAVRGPQQLDRPG